MFNVKHSIPARHQLAPSALDEFITELISARMGIRPEEVTTEFIHIWREQEFYPTAHFELATTYSRGYNGVRRKALTGNEVVAQSDKAKAFFRKLSNGNEGE